MGKEMQSFCSSVVFAAARSRTPLPNAAGAISRATSAGADGARSRASSGPCANGTAHADRTASADGTADGSNGVGEASAIHDVRFPSEVLCRGTEDLKVPKRVKLIGIGF